MSNFLAAATVTATLQRTLQDAVQADVPGARVSTVRPAEGANTDIPSTGVNAFLYQVTPNPQLRNNDLPQRRSDGVLVQRPQAAVNLHYLLSFYGSEPSLEPQRLLGSTVAFLHSQPLLTRAQVEAAVADSTKPFLDGSDLADSVEVVRFSPLSMSLEEFSRLWSVFFQIRYVLSIAYEAAVVLIERQLTPRPALPARELRLVTATSDPPAVARVVAASGADDPIVADAIVAVEGEALSADVVRVEIDGAPAAEPTEIGAQRLVLALPAGLGAGAHGLRVRHGVAIGAPGVDHLGASSNPASFVLHPLITQVDVSNVMGTGLEPRSADVETAIAPSVAADQLVTLQLLSGGAVAHTFRAQPRAGSADPVRFAIAGVAAGSYVLRVSVDGAESPLELDADGHPVGPQETIG